MIEEWIYACWINVRCRLIMNGFQVGVKTVVGKVTADCGAL